MPPLPIRYRTQLAHAIVRDESKGPSLTAAHEFLRNVINGELEDDNIAPDGESYEFDEQDRLTNEILFGLRVGECVADIMVEDKIKLSPDMEMRIQRGKLVPGVRHRVIVDLMEEECGDE